MNELIRQLLPVLTVIANVIALVLIGACLTRGKISKSQQLVTWVSERAVLFSAIVALTATLGSLFYSEVLQYTPCKLCWLERIFMYPQTILLIAAHIWQERHILKYTILLTVPGLLLAAYHYLLQIGVFETGACSTVGFSVSCSERFFMTYGYITIPMMCVSAFVLLLLFFVIHKRVPVSQEA